ncbi:MAG TPA: PKD domain-containing protein, partial [Saprospiraceae bacterium]|nr:PKD domain-containing protein [Saprospiraceae bacterium]
MILIFISSQSQRACSDSYPGRIYVLYIHKGLQKYQFFMRHHGFLAFFWLYCLSLNAQPYFEIFGPQIIQDPCDFYTYYLEGHTPLIEETEWELIPSNGSVLSGFTEHITLQFPFPGEFILIATSTFEGGLQLVDSLTIFVYEQQSPFYLSGCYELNEVTNCYQVCAFSTTTIHGPIIQGEFWISGADDYFSNDTSEIKIKWGAAGHGEVRVYTGCNFFWCFEILPEPISDFVTSPPTINDTLTICQNQEIEFINQSHDGVHYSWDFGDGSQSETYNTTHSFKNAGYHTVTLIAGSICSCASEKKIIVNVLPVPVPELDCVNSVCPETKQLYTATTDGCNQYTWTISSNGTIVNGGGINDDFIEIIWHDGPDGIIELSVDDCASQYCSYANIFRIPIITPNGPITGDSVVCAGETTKYEVPYFPGTEYSWQVAGFGQILGESSKNSIVVQWQQGNILSSSEISVQYHNCFLECGGEDELIVLIRPAFYLEGDPYVCQNGEATVESKGDLIFPEDVLWHLENELGEIVFTNPGITSTVTHTFSYPPGNYQWVATNT